MEACHRDRQCIGKVAEGVLPHEIGVFVRSGGQMDRARRSVQAAKLKELELHGNVETKTGHVAIMTMQRGSSFARYS